MSNGIFQDAIEISTVTLLHTRRGTAEAAN